MFGKDGTQPGTHFAVDLKRSGGEGFPVSYTYDVYSFDTDKKIGSAMKPAFRPTLNAAVPTPAVRGVGYVTRDGEFVLVQAYETYGSGSCV